MQKVRLGDVCKLNMGQSPDSSSYNENKEGIPFFQGNADFGEVYPNLRVWCRCPIKTAKIGDILISVRAPIGALNMANMECCIGRGLAALTVNEKICNKKYFWYCIKSQVEELKSKGTGSTFKAISKDALSETILPIYPLEQQQQIVSVLDKISLLIDKRKKQLTKLDELVKSRFVEMFGDVVVNDRRWPMAKFGDVTDSRLGKMLDAKKQTGRNIHKYLANFNVQWFRIDDSELHEMDFDAADQIEFELKEGDLLVCEGGESGRCCVWRGQIRDCYYQKALHRVRCNPERLNPDFLAYWFWMNCHHGAFEHIIGAKATIAHLTGVKLKKLDVILPPLALQREFAAFVEKVDKLAFKAKASLEKLETLKKAMMQKYFN